MQIIAHRGASSDATENSAKAISLAASLPVRYIEFDIQYTKNNRVIVHHDTETPSGLKICENVYAALVRELPTIITLEQALMACNDTPALIEPKVAGTIARSLKILKKYPAAAIASFIADEILATRIHAPQHVTFLLQHYHPFGIIKKAVAIDAHGIGLNKYWLAILPYFYFQARKNHLQIYIYTVNSAFLARFISSIMPHAMLCTDRPNEFTKFNNK